MPHGAFARLRLPRLDTVVEREASKPPQKPRSGSLAAACSSQLEAGQWLGSRCLRLPSCKTRTREVVGVVSVNSIQPIESSVPRMTGAGGRRAEAICSGRGDVPGVREYGQPWCAILLAGGRGSLPDELQPSGRVTSPPGWSHLRGGGAGGRGRKPRARCDDAWLPRGSCTTRPLSGPQLHYPRRANFCGYAKLHITAIM